MKPRFLTNTKPGVLIVVIAGFLTAFADADLTNDQAAVVEGSKQTQRYLDEHDYEKALNSAQSTYELSVKVMGEDNLNTAVLGETYANLLGLTGSGNRAKKLYKKTIDIYTDRYGKDSLKSVPAILGYAKYSGAKDQQKYVRRALTILRTQTPEDKLAYAEAAVEASEFLTRSSKNHETVQEILGEALDIYEAEFGKKSVEMIQPFMLRGKAAATEGKPRKARGYFDRAISIAEKKLSKSHQALLLGEAGSALLRYSRSINAKGYLLKAHKLSAEMFGEDSPRTALAAMEVGRYHMADQKLDRAETLFKQSLGVIEQDPNYRSHQMAVLSLLVELHETQGRRDEATPYCQAIGAIAPWTSTQDYRPIFKKAPKYPQRAITARSEGYVLMEYEVDKYGFVQDPKVIESTGHETLVAASFEAVDTFRYAPAYKDGEAVSTQGVRNKFTFHFR